MWAKKLSAEQFQYVLHQLLSDDPQQPVGFTNENGNSVLLVGQYHKRQVGLMWHLEINLGVRYTGMVEWDSDQRCMSGYDILDRKAKDRLLREMLAEHLGVNQLNRNAKSRLSRLLYEMLR